MKNKEIQVSEKHDVKAGSGGARSITESILLARRDERERLGHELHDNVNQMLISARLYLSILDRECPEFELVRGRAMEILKEGMDEIRRLSREMVNDELRGDGLVCSIRRLVDDLRVTGLFEIRFEHSDMFNIEGLSKCKKVALYRIVQEQIKNIIAYSSAKNIEIILHCSDLQFRMQIRDDGIGFDAEIIKKGLGLTNIYERAKSCNGKVLLNAAPGKGCSLTINFPTT
ncbi:MAG: sensor histidine kinase [Bacteroidetes bacterium]|nr:sensor histidine kinase [Bacteroidota bacterium]